METDIGTGPPTTTPLTPPEGEWNDKVKGLTGSNPRHPPRGPNKKTENETHGASAGQAPKNQKCCKKQGTRFLLDRFLRNKSPRPLAPQCNVEQKETCFCCRGLFFRTILRSPCTQHCTVGEWGAGFYFAQTGSAGHVLASMHAT